MILKLFCRFPRFSRTFGFYRSGVDSRWNHPVMPSCSAFTQYWRRERQRHTRVHSFGRPCGNGTVISACSFVKTSGIHTFCAKLNRALTSILRRLWQVVPSGCKRQYKAQMDSRFSRICMRATLNSTVQHPGLSILKLSRTSITVNVFCYQSGVQD